MFLGREKILLSPGEKKKEKPKLGFTDQQYR